MCYNIHYIIHVQCIRYSFEPVMVACSCVYAFNQYTYVLYNYTTRLAFSVSPMHATISCTRLTRGHLAVYTFLIITTINTNYGMCGVVLVLPLHNGNDCPLNCYSCAVSWENWAVTAQDFLTSNQGRVTEGETRLDWVGRARKKHTLECGKSTFKLYM